MHTGNEEGSAHGIMELEEEDETGLTRSSTQRIQSPFLTILHWCRTNISKDQWSLLLSAFLVIVVLSVEYPEGCQKVGRGAAVLCCMAVWWIFEAVPLHVTALLPIPLCPLLGIVSSREIAKHYFNSVSVLNIAGFLISEAIRQNGLHIRLSLGCLHVFGRTWFGLVASLTVSTWLMSNFMSNLAATVTMVPIAVAVIDTLSNATHSVGRPQCEILLLCVAYGASIGGLGTLIGTTTNLVLADVMAHRFPHAPPVTFLQWLSYGMPLSVSMLLTLGLVAWWVFSRHHQPVTSADMSSAQRVLSAQWKDLGPMTLRQKIILVWAGLLVQLWLFRGLLFGSTKVIADVDDGALAVLFLMPILILPLGDPLVKWKDHQGCVNFEIMILLGGGFALAETLSVSGFSSFAGNVLISLQTVPAVGIIIASQCLMVLLTQVMSNVSAEQVLLPLVAELAIATQLHPLVLMIPVTFAASCAFTLPVSTPANMIVYSTGRVSQGAMIRVGTLLTVACSAMVMVYVILVLPCYTDISMTAPLPEWATERQSANTSSGVKKRC